jgi:hypothetical protein
MFARRPSQPDPLPLTTNGELPELPEMAAPPKMLDAFAQRFLGVTMTELQTIGSGVAGFLKEAREKLDRLEAQQTRILELLEARQDRKR